MKIFDISLIESLDLFLLTIGEIAESLDPHEIEYLLQLTENKGETT